MSNDMRVNTIEVYLVVNCYEDGDKATVWLRFGRSDPAVGLESDKDARRILGPVDRALCYPTFEALISVFKELGMTVVSDQIADD